MKNNALESATLPSLSYGAQTWAVTKKKQLRRMQIVNRDMKKRYVG